MTDWVSLNLYPNGIRPSISGKSWVLASGMPSSNQCGPKISKHLDPQCNRKDGSLQQEYRFTIVHVEGQVVEGLWIIYGQTMPSTVGDAVM